MPVSSLFYHLATSYHNNFYQEQYKNEIYCHIIGKVQTLDWTDYWTDIYLVFTHVVVG